MATNKTLPQLPSLVIPSTGDITYAINGAQSYQLVVDRIARLLITEYNIFSSPLNASVMTSSTAEVMLDGLNNASTAKLNAGRLNVDWDSFVSGYFDIDGGTFYDTYVNTSTFDGGTF